MNTSELFPMKQNAVKCHSEIEVVSLEPRNVMLVGGPMDGEKVLVGPGDTTTYVEYSQFNYDPTIPSSGTAHYRQHLFCTVGDVKPIPIDIFIYDKLSVEEGIVMLIRKYRR
jgi:hypothetical protein